MTLPMRYNYDPPWWIVIGELLVAGMMATLVVLGWVKPLPGLAAASVFMSFVVVLVIRRVMIRRYLDLNLDALLLPTGFLQLRSAYIPYEMIMDVWEAPWAFGTVLYVRTQEKRFEIACGVCLHREEYVEVRDFLLRSVAKPG
jgi:hypothetical protein